VTRLVLAFALLGALATARAQVALVLEYPEGMALELSVPELVFDLSRVGFPPPELPAYYAPTAPQGPVTLRLFNNLEGGWLLEAKLDGLANEDGQWIPPDRIEVRLNGGPWIALSQPVVLWTGSGPTGEWRSFTLELRFKAVGDELPGRYQGLLVLALSRL